MWEQIAVALILATAVVTLTAAYRLLNRYIPERYFLGAAKIAGGFGAVLLIAGFAFYASTSEMIGWLAALAVASGLVLLFVAFILAMVIARSSSDPAYMLQEIERERIRALQRDQE